MASSLFALLDDIATLLDDIAVLTKVAAQKTAGVLGDDLALNAQQVAGVNADRELPVVWAVARGSFVNKAILVPAALAISALAPWAITPLLMLGGAYLCFEGFEKLAHKFLHSQTEDDAHHKELTQALVNPEVDLVALERDKIKGAVRTDFILSAEIIVITLGSVAAASFGKQVAVLCTIAILMTVGVYGLVGAIVKLDDFGYYLSRMEGAGKVLQRKLGALILRAAPLLMYILDHVHHAGALGWVYVRALDLLGQLRDPQAIPALSAALRRGEWWAPRRTATLRAAAASALARIGTTEAVAALIEASQTGSRGVRRAARTQLDTIARSRNAGGRTP